MNDTPTSSSYSKIHDKAFPNTQNPIVVEEWTLGRKTPFLICEICGCPVLSSMTLKHIHANHPPKSDESK